jgi:hypothetical protein
MQKTNDPLDTLKEIILLYANIPPDPIENLRLIEYAMLGQFYLDASGQFQIWENVQSQTILSVRIETVIRIHDLGLAGAAAIHGNQVKTDEFMASVLGYDEPYPPNRERHREWFDSAFSDVYGFTVASYCPCDLAKKAILGKVGYLQAVSESPEMVNVAMPRWLKPRPNCLQCNHLHFVAILEDLSKGNYRRLQESEIVAKYSKTTTEQVEFWNEEQPIRAACSYTYEENDAAFPDYLEGMPCNLLVNLLLSGPYAKKIKRCPHCGKFFISKTARSSIYCSDKCRLDFHNKEYIQSGKAKGYKKQARAAGRYQ